MNGLNWAEVLFVFPHRDKIETFIDENKALMKRMYGDFEMTSRYPPLQQPGQTGGRKRKRHLQGADDPFTILPELMDLYGAPGSADEPDLYVNGGESYFGKLRKKRQSTGRNGSSGSGSGSGSGAGSGNGNGSSRTNGRQSSTDSSGESTGRWVEHNLSWNSPSLICDFFQGWCLWVQDRNCYAVLGFQFSGESPCHREYATLRAGYSSGGVLVSIGNLLFNPTNPWLSLVLQENSNVPLFRGLWLRAKVQMAPTTGVRSGQRLQGYLHGLVPVSFVLRVQV